MNNIKLDRKFLTNTLQQLIKINSINPGLVSGAPGEKEIAEFLLKTLSDLNIETEIDEIEPARFNVTGIIKGSGSGKSLMLNAHTDTVGVESMNNPFSAEIKNGKMYGRGALDMKGSIAAILTVAKTIIENSINLKGDLIFAFVADEEYGSIGTEHLLKKYKTDAAIVTEPTGLDLCIAHKGFGLYEITTKGKSAHGGKPEDGIDANRNMSLIMTELEKIYQNLKTSNQHPLLGLPSMHFPLINGGSEPFTYADKCKLILERRTNPGEFSESILSELNDIIGELATKNNNFNAEVNQLLIREPFETEKTNEIVSTLFESAKNVIGKTPDYIGHSWWEDSALIANEGIDTVIFGPAGEGLHSEIEWVDIQSVVDLSKILLSVVIDYCN